MSDRFCGHIVAAAPELRQSAGRTGCTEYICHQFSQSSFRQILVQFSPLPIAMWWGGEVWLGRANIHCVSPLIEFPHHVHWEVQAK